ncbi:uncharacterized protein LOC144440546 isoform X2 [Glandiceps talaboti]
MANEVLVVDFSAYSVDRNSPDSELFPKLIDDVHDAFTNTGFVYLTNHGIDERMIKNAFTISRRFFELPTEVKVKHARPLDHSSNDGYVGIEVETLNPAERPGDYKEAFNYMRFCEQAPDEVPEFRQAMRDLFDKCTVLCNRLLEIMGRGLKLEDPFLFVKANKLAGTPANDTMMRTLYYPPIPENVQLKPNQIRCGEHSDYGSITLLFQDNHGGLELKAKDGNFIPANPIEGTVVVNIADLMQRWTTDKLISVVHRVIIPDIASKTSCRQSLAYFSQPDSATVIRCIDGSDKYPPITGGDYVQQKFEVTY